MSDDGELDAVLARLAASGVDDAPVHAQAIRRHVMSLPPAERVVRARALAEACVAGTPLAYLIGYQTFMGLDFLAERGVIVPRPVSERVVRAALRLVDGRRHAAPSTPLQVVDMCSGSGNLACAIAHALPNARVFSCDLMPASSDLARRNAERLGLSDRVMVRTGDLFQAVADDGLEGSVDLITASPPFISSGRLSRDRAHLLDHEPREAFDAGPYGLSIHQRITNDAPRFLRPGGYVVLEVGEGQSRQVSRLLERARAFDAIEVVDEGDGAAFVVAGRRAAT